MAIWILMLIIFAFGFVGGTVNAVIVDRGLKLPSHVGNVFDPGWLGNAGIGGIAAVVSWCIYGPLAAATVIPRSDDAMPLGTLALAAVGGAILTGIAGARWLSKEVNEKILRETVDEVTKSNPKLNEAVNSGTPAEAFQAAQRIMRTHRGLDDQLPPGPALTREPKGG